MSLGGVRGVGAAKTSFFGKQGCLIAPFTLKTAVGGDRLPQQRDVGAFLEG